MTVASMVVVGAALLAALLVGAQLPPDAQVPVHWNIHGDADRFMGKWPALFGPPLVTALVCCLFYFLPRLEPRRAGLERSLGFYSWSWAGVLMISTAWTAVTVLSALGQDVPVVPILASTVALMFVLIGNQMGKSRSMYMVGIRTPWTLASEEVWIKTHRLAGKLTVASGLLILGAAMGGVPRLTLALLFVVGIVAIAVIPTIYSYVAWRREQVAHAGEDIQGE